MSWSQRTAEAQLRPIPAANSADSANRSDAAAIGSIGTIGTGPLHSAQVTVGKRSALLAPSAPGFADFAPCPADLAKVECHNQATARALADHGLSISSALANEHLIATEECGAIMKEFRCRRAARNIRGYV